MLKNAIIALLATGLLFSNTILAGYGFLVYLAMSAVAFVIVCAIEDMWEKHRAKIRRFKKFNKDINEITLNQPTKAS